MSDNRQIGSQNPPKRPGGGFMGGPAIVEKPKNFKATWGNLIKYCSKYMPMLILSVVLAVSGTVFIIIGPSKMQSMVDLIEDALKSRTSLDLAQIGKIATMLIVFYASSLVLRFADNWIMATATQKIAKNLRSDVSKKINVLPLKYFDKVSFGDVLSRVTNDVDTIAVTMNQSIDMLLASIALFLGSVTMMLITNWILALATIGASLLGFVLISLIMAKSQKFFIRQQRELGEANGYVEEIYSAHNVIRAYNGSSDVKTAFEQINSRLEQSARKSQFMSGLMQPLMTLAGTLGYIAVCVVGSVLVLNGMSYGVIAAFLIYVRIFSNPLNQIAQCLQSLQRTAAASERVFEFLNEEELSDESGKTAQLSCVKGDVEFKNVRFGYVKDKTVINDFSSKVKSGQKIAIVGPTGAGKTTMVNLLMRFYEIDGGQILIDNTPIDSVKRENVHDQFCMVLQDTWLFEGTIKENIVYSKQGVGDDEVINACKAVGLHHFIQTLPLGYDTILDDKASLSQGQKQLITIARAMIQNSPMLILDEATSSVDTRTEILIQEAMDRLTADRTSFVIAHRLSTIKNADMILVMKDGDIVENGSHNELIEKGGFYCQLYNSQFEALN